MGVSIYFVITISICLPLVIGHNVSYRETPTVLSNTVDYQPQIDNQDIVKSQLSFVAVYGGAVAEIYCRSKDEEKVLWTYAKSPSNLSFTPLPPNERAVTQNRSIFIYRTTFEDAGVYKCQTDGNQRELVILEVINDDTYTVNEESDPSTTSRITWRLEDFPGGVPCRSRHLPPTIRNLPPVQNKPNVIMIASCKVQCKTEIYQQTSSSGIILETANNTAGIYSLSQQLPPQPPTPARNIMFVGRGQRVLVKCAGTTLRDIPVTWRVGNLPVDPDILRESSGGRVYVDARDHIVIAHVLYEDVNLYSCWEADNLAGTVKLEVWTGRQATWNHHTVLLVMLIIGALAMRLAVKIA